MVRECLGRVWAVCECVRVGVSGGTPKKGTEGLEWTRMGVVVTNAGQTKINLRQEQGHAEGNQGGRGSRRGGY